MSAVPNDAPRKPRPQTIKQIADNRRARFEYIITQELEVGIMLVGTEVKSLRQGKVQLSDGYAHLQAGELFLANVHISPYTHGNIFNPLDKRTRKLLATSPEIEKLRVHLQNP